MILRLKISMCLYVWVSVYVGVCLYVQQQNQKLKSQPEDERVVSTIEWPYYDELTNMSNFKFNKLVLKIKIGSTLWRNENQ